MGGRPQHAADPVVVPSGAAEVSAYGVGWVVVDPGGEAARGWASPGGADAVAAIMRDRGVSRPRLLARAGSDAASVDAAEAALGIEAEQLTTEDEGRLVFEGATAGLGQEGRLLVVEPGAMATALAWGHPGMVEGTATAPGADTMAAWLEGDPPTPIELSQAVSVGRDQFDGAAEALPDGCLDATVIGAGPVAAMAVRLAAADTGQTPGPVHLALLSRADAESAFRAVARAGRDERALDLGLEPPWLDAALPAMVVVVTLLRGLDLPGLIVSERGFLDGVLAGEPL